MFSVIKQLYNLYSISDAFEFHSTQKYDVLKGAHLKFHEFPTCACFCGNQNYPTQ